VCRLRRGEHTRAKAEAGHDAACCATPRPTQEEPPRITAVVRFKLPADVTLAAATELFYAEGIHTVGIDRVIERAGVAKASLYSTFGSKDELVRAYLQARAEARRTRYTERLARYPDPRDRILAIFDLLAESVVAPSYRGCAFINASAEGPRDDSPVTQVTREMRGWLRALGGLGITYVGPRALPFGERSDPVVTLDGSLQVSWAHTTLAVKAANLLDTRYRLGEYNDASDFHSQAQPTLAVARQFTAGAPRSVLVQLEVHL